MEPLSRHPTAPNDITPPFRPDIVNNIPIHQAAAPPAPPGDDVDRLLQDVNREVGQDDRPAKKKHWFSKQPKPAVRPAPHPAPAQPALPIQQPSPAPQHQPAARPNTKPPRTAQPVPYMAIFMALVITAVLIAAAIAAYKK